MFVADRGDVGFERLRGDDPNDAQRARGVEEVGVAGAANLLVFVAQEEDWAVFARSGRHLGAGVEGLEEALFEKQVHDARGGFEALTRHVDDEHRAVEHLVDVRLGVFGGAEGVLEQRAATSDAEFAALLVAHEIARYSVERPTRKTRAT